MTRILLAAAILLASGVLVALAGAAVRKCRDAGRWIDATLAELSDEDTVESRYRQNRALIDDAAVTGHPYLWLVRGERR